MSDWRKLSTTPEGRDALAQVARMIEMAVTPLRLEVEALRKKIETLEREAKRTQK